MVRFIAEWPSCFCTAITLPISSQTETLSNWTLPPHPLPRPAATTVSPVSMNLHAVGPYASRTKSVCPVLSGLFLLASRPSLGQAVACVRLWSVSLRWLAMPNNFFCTYWLFVYLLWRNVYSGPLHIFKRSCFLLLLSYIFSILIPYPIHDSQIFSHPLRRLSTLLIVYLDA